MRTRRGQLTLPGGRIEPGESPAEAAAREGREEAGAEGDLDPQPVIVVRVIKRPGDVLRRSSWVTPVFMLEVTRQRPPRERWRRPEWVLASQAELRLRRPWAPRWRVAAVRATIARLADGAS